MLRWWYTGWRRRRLVDRREEVMMMMDKREEFMTVVDKSEQVMMVGYSKDEI